MTRPRPIFVRLLSLVVGLLILKVVLVVLLSYRDYFPPNFAADFLRDRQAYFFGPYQWAFYTHITSGPVTLLLGLVLLSERFRTRFPHWHRALGKTQVALVLLLLAPSGLWMARYAATGTVAATGFALLAIATAACVLFGWRAAVNRRFAEHRRWMLRCLLLLSSAVVIRVIGGLVIVTEYEAAWPYPLTAWVSWLAPLAAYECGRAMKRRANRFAIGREVQFVPSGPGSSFPALEISARSRPASTSERINPAWQSANPATNTLS